MSKETGALISDHHRKLHGFSAADCQKLTLELEREWDLFGSTIFTVQQNYTNDIPTQCWLAVNRDGIHILERFSKDAISSHPWAAISSFTPTHKAILITTESVTNGTKYGFNTTQASTIAFLMKDYIEWYQQTQMDE